jgi:extradiol dioxygenase family protein
LVRVRPAFHLAIPVLDIASTRAFYGGVLQCREGRASERWVDFDLEGHQLSAHVAPEACPGAHGGAHGGDQAGDAVGDAVGTGSGVAERPVDGDSVPVRHFGLVLPWERWESLAERLRAHGASFLIEPRVRFQGEVGEQGTFFVRDPSGNALEFKSFRDPARLFASD